MHRQSNLPYDSHPELEVAARWLAARPGSWLARLAMTRMIATTAACPEPDGSRWSQATVFVEGGRERLMQCFAMARSRLDELPPPLQHLPLVQGIRLRLASQMDLPDEEIRRLYLAAIDDAPLLEEVHAGMVAALCNMRHRDCRVLPLAQAAADTVDPGLADAVYAQVARLLFQQRGRATFDTLGFDWERTRSGLERLVGLDVDTPSCERALLRMACMLDDRPRILELAGRPMTRRLLGKPELEDELGQCLERARSSE
jgi:hypothetical protein